MSDLDNPSPLRQWGEIGISAVAAAVRKSEPHRPREFGPPRQQQAETSAGQRQAQ